MISAIQPLTSGLEVRGSVPLIVQANDTAELVIASQSVDGGTSTHRLNVDFSDGTRSTAVINVDAPVRGHRRFVYELQPAVDVIVAGTGAFAADEVRAHFTLLLRSLSGAQFYRFHVLTMADGGIEVETIPANAPDFEVRTNTALSTLANLASPIDAVDSVFDHLELHPATFPEIVIFTSGSENSERPVADLLNRFTLAGSKPAAVWMFVRGSSCPTRLSSSYQVIADASVYFQVFDSCVGLFDTELLAIQKNDVTQTTRWFFSGDEFRPSLTIRYDDVVTNTWWTRSSPNGDYFELYPGSFGGKREYSVDYDLLTGCELDAGM